MTRQSTIRWVAMAVGLMLAVVVAAQEPVDNCASLLGSLIVSSLGLAGVSRTDIPEETRTPFFVYLDEFHTFTTLSLAGMLSELRKYRVGLILSHQFVFQLEEEVKHAVLGNVGTLVCFRIGPEDARILGEYFSPEFESLDLTNLPNRNVYVRLLVHGEVARPFSATTLEPLWKPGAADRQERRAA